MPNHKINWVNDHTEICDRLDERVQLMQDYLDSKPDASDGIATKRFLLGQAREQVSWYRQSIEALDFVGCVACRRALETGQSFLEHYLPVYNFRETEKPNASGIWQLKTGSDHGRATRSSIRSSNAAIIRLHGA